MGAIAGSAMASASAMGSILGPEMKKEGYDKEYGAAVNITSSTIGLIIILTLGLTIYGVAAFGQEKSEGSDNNLQTKKSWDQFKGGFFVGACGSAGFAFICLSSIPTFTIT